MKISRKLSMASWGALLSGAALFADSALASDGFININGELTAQSCQVLVGGSSQAQLTLPTIAASSLINAGDTAGATPFTFTLTGCPTTEENFAVRTFFETTNVDLTTGNLINTDPAGASNVQVQITDADSQVINLADSSSNAPITIATDGSGSITYNARYIAVGGSAGVGLVNTQLIYTLQYQ